MSSVDFAVVRPLRVAVELVGAGHHPAATAAPGNRAVPENYWVELTDPGVTEPLDLTSDPAEVVRIRAVDLRDAQQQRTRIRAAAAADGRDPDSITVLVDVEILVADEARAARKELAQLDSALDVARAPLSLQYIGTGSGLAGLISDIQAADVADGVTLLPLSLPRVLQNLVEVTLPWLGDRGVQLAQGAADDALARFGLSRDRRVLAS
ncbi:hypothetical protein [Rhodococcus sp. NPDC058521]|uniref:hypothetical protein n=1 Tax=Rhodococcus sp. NPDC058521 TaxID=3346536 RepID=UPI0036564D0D